MRLLIVDDDEYILKVLSFMLDQEGYDITLCTNVEEGMNTLDREAFDMVITDIFMPKLQKDGTHIAIRSKTKSPSTPVLAITGGHNGEISEYVSYIEQFVDKLMIKPISKNELLKTIEELTAPPC